MTTLNKVVASLQAEYLRLRAETEKVGKALEALGQVSRNGQRRVGRKRRRLSKEARRRIAAAQRLRWAKARRAAKAAK